MVRRHLLSHHVPISRVERCSCWPAGVVGGSGRVFEFVGGTRGGKVGERVDVGIEGKSVVDIEGTRVDFIHAKATVQVGKWSDAGANPARNLGMGSVLDSRVIGVIDHHLILVGMAVEDIGYYMWGISVHDLVE